MQVDSFLASLSRSEQENLGDQPDRVAIELEAIYPSDSKCGALRVRNLA